MNNHYEFIRNLNAYENMLFYSSVNVGINLTLYKQDIDITVEKLSSILRTAWRQIQGEYHCLRTDIIPSLNIDGSQITTSLGMPAHKFMLDKNFHQDDTFHFHTKDITNYTDNEYNFEDYDSNLLENRLMKLSSTQFSGSTLFNAFLFQDNQQSIQFEIIININHACGDGPGVLEVAHTYLTYLFDIIKCPSIVNKEKKPRYLIDLQALIPNELVENDKLNLSLYKTNIHLIPSEQNLTISSELNMNLTPQIKHIFFNLSINHTSSLLQLCRDNGVTFQGLLCLLSSLSLIYSTGFSLPQAVTMLVPVSCRSYVDPSMNRSDCLCASSGVLFTLNILSNSNIWDLSRQCSTHIHDLIDKKQMFSFIRMIMNSPSNIPPYTLMCSSVGVSPIQTSYGENIQVNEARFCGSSFHCTKESKATMLHVVTSNNSLHFTFNYTYPGVSQNYAKQRSSILKKLFTKILDNPISILN